jgi:SAM-dependent methyltransferase
MHPMADTFIDRQRAHEPDRVYPLICDLCAQCGQIQLRTVTNPAERYVDHEYSYTSSNSPTSRAHWSDYASHVSGRVGLPKGAVVVEIGSNDGYLSSQFTSLGYCPVGVDPSPPMARLAAQCNVQTITAFFDQPCARSLRETLPETPSLIVANNVFNHANEPLDFLLGVKHLLAPEGTFVFELPYWLRLVEKGGGDQIYHEHVTYFTVTYAERLIRLVGMHLADVEEVDYHGGSLRVYARHGERARAPATARPFIDAEAAARLYDPGTYRRFMAQALLGRDRFLETLYKIRRQGGRIVCVGAPAKGNTFLNFYNLDASVIDFVTDASPAKQGKLTPRTRIPIVDDALLETCGAVHAIILSWNLSGALRARLKQINPHIAFLNPYEESA